MAFISGKQSYEKNIAGAKKAFMHNGLYVSAFRGRDATGMALVNGIRARPSIHKKAMSSADYLDLRSTAKVLDDVDRCQAVLGHTRSSTRGWVSDENAHPFQSEHITLIHNGTIPNYKTLQSKCDSDVDSAHVCAAFAEKGAIPTLERISGEYAFIWHDAKEGTVSVARNGGRTLFWAFVPEWEGYVFMSEQEFIGLTCGRNNIKLSTAGIVYPTEHTVYTFDLTKKNMEYTSSAFVPLSARSRHGPRTSTTSVLRDWRDEKSRLGYRTADITTTSEEERATLGISKEEFDFLVSLASDAKERIARLNPKHMIHWSRPQSPKTKLKAAERVKEAGFRPTQIYGARAVVFQEYKKQVDFGCGAIRLIGHNLILREGEIHNLDRHDWEAVIRQKNIFGEVVNIRMDKDRQFVIFNINQQFLRRALNEYEDELKETHQAKDGPTTFIIGPEGILIAKERWEGLLKNGCSMCTNTIHEDLADQILWMNSSPLCPSCADDPHVRLYLGLRTDEGETNVRQINRN